MRAEGGRALIIRAASLNNFQIMKREDQQDATIRCLLLTSVSTCFGHHYAHLQEKKGPVTAFGVLFWICWMWFVATNHIQQNQNNTPNAVTGPFFS
jgi:glycerol-3-phosphate acyltransferase PlsY